MGGMSTRNEIKARLGFIAEPRARMTASRAGNTLRAEIGERLGLFGKSRFAGDRGCGTGAGGFQPGNTCGKEDGKGGGGGDAKKKKKKKTKKPTKPRKEPKETERTRREAEQIGFIEEQLESYVGDVDYAREDARSVLEELEDTLSGRVDKRAKQMVAEARKLVRDIGGLLKQAQNIDTEGTGSIRRGVVTSRQLADQAKTALDRINELNSASKRLKKGAKRTPKAHLQKVTENFWNMYENATFDSFDLEMDLSEVRGLRTKEGKAAKKELANEIAAWNTEVESLTELVRDEGDVYDMEDPDEIKQATEQAISATKQYAALQRRARELSRRIEELAKRPRPAKKAKKATSSRKLRAGLLDRLGAAVGALTQKTVSPSTPAYQTTLEAAKKQAVEAVKSYQYMRDLNAQQFKALDDYVKATAKAIATLRSVPDIQRLTAGIVRATTSRNHARQYLKTPFSRPGAKAKMDKSAALAIVGKAIADVPAGAQRDALQKALIDYYDNTQASNRLLKQGNTTDANRFAVEAGRAAQIAVRTWDRMGKPAAELRGFTQNLERAAEFARPGATANFCDVATKGLDYRARAAKGRQPSDLEREDVKAGLKLMAASDKAVSDKIRTLIAEGKPQDQAVAIALDMKRRGEL